MNSENDNESAQCEHTTEQYQADGGVRQEKTETLAGGVTIELPPNSGLAEVTHYCVGCGDKIRVYEIFDDRIEDELGTKPIHDSAKCLEKAENLRDSDEEVEA